MPKSDKNTGTILIAVGLGCMVVCGGLFVVGLGALLFLAPKEETPVYVPAVVTPPATGGAPIGPGPDGVAGKIAGLYQKGGSGEWDSAVLPIMTGAYDLNGSGSINKSPEVTGIPCGTWRALDAGVLESWDYGVRTIYGFEADYSWVGGAIGFDESIRVEADARLAHCLSAAPTTAPPTAGGGVGTAGAGGAVAQQIRGISAFGGGSAWDDAVETIIVKAYDGNRSGQVDTRSELAAIPCDVWKAMDDGVHVKWDYGLRSIYGFNGGGYLGGEIGFSSGMMGPGQSAMIACGLGK